MTDVPFLPAAEAEFLEAVARYEAARSGLGGEFLAEVERAARRITFFPKHGSPYLGGTRRIVLRRFPYNIVYWSDPDDLLIVAVAHQRRSPGYWRNRLADVPSVATSAVTADALLRFAVSLEGDLLTTRTRGAEFVVRVLPGGLEITPRSSGKARLIQRAIVERVCDEFAQTRSMRPGDYQEITFDASYLLALIQRFLDAGTDR